jgi:hypothetical protein
MSLDDHILALKEKHRSLEAAIEEENTRAYPDDIQIHALKKEKLRIKDELTNIAN